MRTALIVAFFFVALALLVALIPEIRERLPRRRLRQEHHVVRHDPDAPPPPARPDLKSEDHSAES